MSIINWTFFAEYVGSQYTHGAREVANNVLNNTGSGDIVLFHDIYPDIGVATELIIVEMTRRGFQFVTVSELLFFSGINLNPGQVYGSVVW